MEVHYIVQETGIKTIPMENKCKKAKWLSEEGLQIAVKRREGKSKGEKERYTHLKAEFQIARRDKKAFFSGQCKEIEENNRMGKTRDFFRRRQWHPTPVLLPGKSHGWRSLEGCSPWGCQASDTTERLHFHFSLSCIGEGNGNSPQCSCLENPRDGGTWWAALYGAAQSRTRLKLLSSSSRELFKMIRDTKGKFHAKMATIKTEMVWA